MGRWHAGLLGGMLLVLVSGHQTAGAVIINFDDQIISGVQTIPGNFYAAQGISFASGDMSPALNAAVAVGNTFTLTSLTNTFIILPNAPLAISDPNFAGGTNLFQDVLMAFSSPITSLSVHSDAAVPERPEIIRLLSLAATGNPNEYRVLAYNEKTDDATSEPGNLLSVSLPGGFSYALFQTTTELEGFDDVNFAFLEQPTGVVPEPASMFLLGSGLAALAGSRRRRRRAH